MGSSLAKPKQRVRAELLNTRTASIDTNALTTFTLLLEIRTQRYMWSLYKIGCIAKSSQQRFCYWWQNIHYHLTNLLLRSEIPSGICAKLRTVAASNNRVHMPWSLSTYASHHFQSLTSLVSPEITRSDHYYYLFAPHICIMYGVVFHAHPVRGESHNQRNTTGEVATLRNHITSNIFDVVRIITSKQQIFSVWSSPDLAKIGFSPDPVLIRAHLWSVGWCGHMINRICKKTKG